MSDDEEIKAGWDTILPEIRSDGDGMIVLHLPNLPPGSLITLTIRIGPEPVAAPEPTPAPVKRYVGGA